MMSLLHFWALNMSVALLSMQGQKALGFHKKILICVPKMNKGFTSLERHDGGVINDRILILGWTIPLKVRSHLILLCKVSQAKSSNFSCHTDFCSCHKFNMLINRKLLGLKVTTSLCYRQWSFFDVLIWLHLKASEILKGCKLWKLAVRQLLVTSLVVQMQRCSKMRDVTVN